MALNIADLAEHAIDAVPDRVALICGDEQITYALRQVEGVYGLDKADAAHLKQIVHALAAPGEFLYDGQHQPEVSRYKLVPCLGIAGLRLCDERQRFLAFQNRQACGVDAAYLYFSLQSIAPLSCEYFHGSKV